MVEAHTHPELVSQEQCEKRRSQIEKDYDDLALRVEHSELFDAKQGEKIKTLFTFVKFLSGIAATVLAALIGLIIKGALGL